MLKVVSMPFIRPNPKAKSAAKPVSGLTAYVEAEKLLHIAFVLPASALIGWGAGAWADSCWHQSWIAIVGIVFGCVSGLFYVIRYAMAAEKTSRSENSPQNGTGKGNADHTL